jgi:hypothetical protein
MNPTDTRSAVGALWMVGQHMLATDMEPSHVGGWKRLRELPDAELLNTIDAHRDDFIVVVDGLWFRADPIHTWFNLTYSSYLVLPRSLLQSTPFWWQAAFVKLLHWLEARAPKDAPGSYRVQAIDDNGRYVADPYRDYERGRRVVPLTEDAP